MPGGWLGIGGRWSEKNQARLRNQKRQHNQRSQRYPVQPSQGLEKILRADRGLQINYVIGGGAGLMVVIVVMMVIEVVAVPRMNVRAEVGSGTDVRMRRIERHQHHAEVQYQAQND